MATNHETCPPGFRRPRDGDPWGGATLANNTAAMVQQSEMRQSLFLMPQTHTTGNLANSVFGFYADGFFDRRLPTNATGGAVNRINASTVAAGTTQIAHRGTLFFNTESGASLFFPAAGFRSTGLPNPIDGGGLTSVGVAAGYWSSTQGEHHGWAWLLSIAGTNTSVNIGVRGNGLTVRCVAE